MSGFYPQPTFMLYKTLQRQVMQVKTVFSLPVLDILGVCAFVDNTIRAQIDAIKKMKAVKYVFTIRSLKKDLKCKILE